MRILIFLLTVSFTLKAQSLTDMISIEYGKYCGPQSSSVTPVDSIDACCKVHDKDLRSLKEAAKTYSIINANMNRL